MPAKMGDHLGGIRTLADLLRRCREDEITGCMVFRGAHTRVWLAEKRAVVELTTAIGVLLRQPLEAGQLWVPICGNKACCLPEHRKIGTRSDLMRIMRPTLPAAHRAKIAAAHRKREGSKYSPALKATILQSDDTCAGLARANGVHVSLVSRVRRGEAWRDAEGIGSVFALGAAMHARARLPGEGAA